MIKILNPKLSQNLDTSGTCEMERLYDWIRDDNREPAQTKFTAGMTRNVAKEIEFLIESGKKEGISGKFPDIAKRAF